MVLVFVEGSNASQRFHRSIGNVKKDQNVTEVAFVCVKFCSKSINKISTVLKGRKWKSVLISSCSGDVSSAIQCVLSKDVESLELRSLQSFDAEIGTIIGKGIASNQGIQKLTLSILTLTSDAILAMMKGRQESTTCIGLQSIRLSCCTIPTIEAVKNVATFLSTTPSLLTLKLDSCKLEDHQMLVILEAIHRRRQQNPRHKVKDILFPYNKCGSQTIQILSRILADPNCQICNLDCGRQYIDDDDNVDYSPLMSALRQNTSLRSLNISYTKIGCNDIMELASTLTMSDSKLESLYLCGNQLTLQSIEALAEALPNTTCLKTLWLTGTQKFGCVGTVMLYEGLKDNMSLEEVLLPPWLPAQANEIEYYTDLNRAGRKLFRDTKLPSSIWPHVLNRVSNRLDIEENETDDACLGSSATARRASTIYHLLRNKVLLEEAGV